MDWYSFAWPVIFPENSTWCLFKTKNETNRIYLPIRYSNEPPCLIYSTVKALSGYVGSLIYEFLISNTSSSVSWPVSNAFSRSMSWVYFAAIYLRSSLLSTLSRLMNSLSILLVTNSSPVLLLLLNPVHTSALTNDWLASKTKLIKLNVTDMHLMLFTMWFTFFALKTNPYFCFKFELVR